MLILLNEQLVLLEVSAMLRHRVAAALGVAESLVSVSWRLQGVKGHVAPVARVLGLGGLVKGSVEPVVVCQQVPELDEIGAQEVERAMLAIVDALRPVVAERLAGLRQRRGLADG